MAEKDKGKALLSWLRKADCPNEKGLGVKKEKEEDDILLSKFNDLGERIKNLEILFKYLKERKERKEKKENDDRESCGSS